MQPMSPYPPPSPRSSGAGTSFAIAILVGAMLLVGSGVLFVLRLRREAPPPSVPTMPVGQPAFVPPEPLPTTAQDDPIPDGPAPPPQTPEASRRARPPWGRLETLTPYAIKTQQFAPQHSRPLDLFRAGGPLAGDVENALVVCRFQSFAHHDTFAGDDLHARMTLGATPEVANDGPEDANLAFVSAPHVTLKKGERASFEVYDRDVFSIALITRASLDYAGASLESRDPGATIECRVVPSGEAARLEGVAERQADAPIGKLAKAKLDGALPSWGWPQSDIGAATRATGDVAAIVGWDDARAKSRADRVTASLASLEDQKKAVFAKLHDDAGAEAKVGNVHLEEARLDCATACTIHAKLRNEGDAVPVSMFRGATFYTATARTGPVAAQAATADGAMLAVIPAKATIDATFAAPHLGSDPAIVAMCIDVDLLRGTVCKPVRLR
ncbi:MAG TPA: hypothetical protein VIF62_19525 [Labilithrix sp.]